MSAAQWQRVKDITADALEREPDARAGYLAEVCSDDPVVHAEALRLVREAGQSTDFLTHPVMKLQDVLPQAPAPPLFGAGEIVAGRFEILAFLNRGGMGEIYAAMDLELREKVALKTIRPAIASSATVIERFKQEVRQTRRVTHPNVCRVYDLFSHELPSGSPVWFLTMELLDGSTLAERIRSSGAMAMREALPRMREMVAALAAAHDLGIVHRDFKPGNVMLVRAGTGAERAVVTDFGLAMNADSESHDRAGTPAYVAPEQAAGAKPGPAADQFSLGIVLAEMLTGKPPQLDRESEAEATRQLRTWLSAQPRSSLNARARAAIARCLAYRSEDRFRSVREVLVAIDGTAGKRRRNRWLAAAGLIAATATILAIFSAKDSSTGFTDALRLTPETDWSDSPSLSRDGKWLAYTSNRGDPANADIWIDSIRGGAARRLTTDPAQDIAPSLAPDASSVIFRSERNGGGVYWIRADGTGEHLLIPGGRNPAYSPDGRLIAYWTGDPTASAPSGQLFIVSATGDQPRRLVPGFENAAFPVWSPDGQYLLFEGCSAGSGPFPGCTELWIARADGGGVTQTGIMTEFRARNLTLYPSAKAWRGESIYVTARRGSIDALWEVPLAKDLRISGQLRQISEAADVEPSFTPGGAIAFARISGSLHTWRIMLDPAGGPARGARVTDAQFGECCPSLSPDGNWLFFTRRVHIVKDLFRKDLNTGAESVILSSPEEKAWPVADSSGKRVAFESIRGAQSSINLLTPGRPPRTICGDCSHPTSWFGSESIFHTSARGDIALLDISTGISRAVLPASGGMTFEDADWSPDNQYLLFTAGSNGEDRRVYAVRFPLASASPEGPRLLLTPEAQLSERPRWSRDGKTLYYLSNRDGQLCIWGQHFTPGETGPSGKPFPVMHYHESLRFSPMQTASISLGFSTAGNSLVINIGEVIETIWAGSENRSSLFSLFRRSR